MIKLQHITKKYVVAQNEHIIALNDISLRLKETGLVVITGTSGCGKTTLLNILGGLDRPTSGEVHLDRVRIDNQNENWWDAFRGSNIGFVYQDFNLLDNMTVRENVKLPLELQELEEVTKQHRLEEMLEELGLSDYMDNVVGKLSGGQKQRVAIARALVTDPKIILADEPTGNLDEENSNNVFKLLKEIARKRLVVVVTHDASLASIYADRLIRISYGVIEKDVVQNEVGENVTDIEKYGVSLKESKQRSLSGRMRWAFVKEAMLRRKARCLVTVLIFSITTFFILMLSAVVFRSDCIPMSEYIYKKNQKIIPLYMDVLEEYKTITDSKKTISGKKFYELISQCVDKSRIIRYDFTEQVQFGVDLCVKTKNLYVDVENKQCFTYEGSFPEQEHEIAISQVLANKINAPDGIIGLKVCIKGKEYTITAIITQICGSNMEDIYKDQEMDENIVVFSLKTLTEMELERSMYMSGFGMISYPSLFYQATVYNYVEAIDDEVELLVGRMPYVDNEILISKQLYDLMIQRNKMILGKTYKFYDYNDSKYGSSYWSNINLCDYMGESVTVVGVARTEADYCVTFSLYERLFDDYMAYHKTQYCLLAEESTLKNDLCSLLDYDVKIMGFDFSKIYMLIDGVEAIKPALFIVVGVLVLLSILQMFSLYYYSIEDSKKTIGILRTMGVNKLDTIKIFMVECVTVFILSYVVAIGIGIFILNGVNTFINDNVLEFYGFDFLQMRFVIVIVAGLLSGTLSALSVIIPIKKYSKKKIIELMK